MDILLKLNCKLLLNTFHMSHISCLYHEKNLRFSHLHLVAKEFCIWLLGRLPWRFHFSKFECGFKDLSNEPQIKSVPSAVAEIGHQWLGGCDMTGTSSPKWHVYKKQFWHTAKCSSLKGHRTTMKTHTHVSDPCIRRTPLWMLSFGAKRCVKHTGGHGKLERPVDASLLSRIYFVATAGEHRARPPGIQARGACQHSQVFLFFASDPCVYLYDGEYVLNHDFKRLFPYVDNMCYFVKCANKKAYLNPCGPATRNDKKGEGFCSHLDLAGFCGPSLHEYHAKKKKAKSGKRYESYSSPGYRDKGSRVYSHYQH